MFPSLCDGDVLLVERVAADDIVRGAVILTRIGDRLTAHRVRAVHHSGGTLKIVTRGDNRREDDEIVGFSSVIGRIAGFRRDGRHHRPPSFTPTLALIARCWVRGACHLNKLQRLLSKESRSIAGLFTPASYCGLRETR